MNHINYHYFLTTIGSRARHVIGLIESPAAQNNGSIAIIVKNNLFVKEVESLLFLHAIPSITSTSQELSPDYTQNSSPKVYIISEENFHDIQDKNITVIISLFSSYSLESIMKKQALCTKDTAIPCHIIEVILQFDIDPIQKLYASHSIAMTPFTLGEESVRSHNRTLFMKDFLQAIDTQSTTEKEEESIIDEELEKLIAKLTGNTKAIKDMFRKIAQTTTPSLEFSSHTNTKRESLRQHSYKRRDNQQEYRGKSSYKPRHTGYKKHYSSSNYKGHETDPRGNFDQPHFKENKEGYRKREYMPRDNKRHESGFSLKEGSLKDFSRKECPQSYRRSSFSHHENTKYRRKHSSSQGGRYHSGEKKFIPREAYKSEEKKQYDSLEGVDYSNAS